MDTAEVRAELQDATEHLEFLWRERFRLGQKLVDQVLATVKHYGKDRSGWPASSEMAVREIEASIATVSRSLDDAQEYQTELKRRLA